jgi:ferritin-like metal-binding protein YciE
MKNTLDKTQNESTSKESSNSELQELLVDELADLLSAETQLTKALPKMAKAAKSEELRDAFQSHLEETENHVERLKEAFGLLDEKVKSKTCKAMKGLVEEGSELMDELEDSSALDAGLIAAAQKVEHYEIASYGSVRAWAQQLGQTRVVDLIEETLDEEKAADQKLTEIAEEFANQASE